MSTNVAVIGKGGREHAIVWKLSQSPQIKQIYSIPGSYGIGQVPKTKNIDINLKDFEAITNFCKANNVELVAIGPEAPLADGLADHLLKSNISVFGPVKQAAQIETSKKWAKDFMERHRIPTAKWQSFTDPIKAKQFIKTADFPALVVKASGLAAGKGVIVAKNQQEACQAVDDILTKRKFGNAGDVVVIEELLIGEEVSVLAFTDGKTVRTMLPAQDHKRLCDNDEGPNTGGMGVYCPSNLLTTNDLKLIEQTTLQRAIDGFCKDGIKYCGVLYVGLMITSNGPRVLEYNCRFGDPETEVILPLLETDLYEIMKACCQENLNRINLEFKPNLTAVGVVLAAKGYPETAQKGDIITGIDCVNQKDNNIVFHMSTALNRDNQIVSDGGRVLITVALAKHLYLAAAEATRAAREIINFNGKQFRNDIAHKGIPRSIAVHGGLSYKSSGVDIDAGNKLVDLIKPKAKSTIRKGVLGSLGGFGGLFDVKNAGFKDPILVSGTDGVGTKLKIAQEMGIHNTIGIDLVAMCVNDVLAHGAEPLFFLDYFACGKLDVSVAAQVLEGIAEGCRQAGCALIGGETAEMPDMYPVGEYDLAGFAVGAVEREEILPKTNLQPNDIIIGLPSSGVHSNGFSMVRKIMKISGKTFKDPAPFSKTGRTFGEEFLTPTTIYIKAVLPTLKKIKAFAHITGGGLIENIPRILTGKLAVELDFQNWEIPSVFGWLATIGKVNKLEMLKTFNCGIGAILVTDPKYAEEILTITKPYGGRIIGKLIDNHGESVIVKNYETRMDQIMRPFINELVEQTVPKKRVAVLISGTGSNLFSLIRATQQNDLGAEIVLVISNKADAYGLKYAKDHNIAHKIINHKHYNTREEFDRALDDELVNANIDIVCLAGFMRILTKEFVQKWNGKLINIHPALLPAFKGMHAQKQALEYGAKITGCTVHFVDHTVDGGQIICQQTVPILVDDTEETLIERIKTVEHQAYPKALELLARGKVKLVNDKLVCC